MKIVHINYSNYIGGASRATYRIHRALINENVNSQLWVNEANKGDMSVAGPSNEISKALKRVIRYLTWPLLKLLKTDNKINHSISLLPSRWVNYINKSDADLIHLHWVQREMLSIKDISKIKKPVIWTLQDMWAFCGAEHYTENFRWSDGYNFSNRPDMESGFDINQWTWRRKVKNWQKPIQIVTSSKWLSSCVQKSALMKDWPIKTIANTIDTNIWQPFGKKISRKLLNLPTEKKLLLFGAVGGEKDPRKGFDLLIRVLKYLNKNPANKNIELVVFGQTKPHAFPDIDFTIHYVGALDDDISLRTLYNTADIMVIPSRQDNLPNTGVEAHACGVPVVAFDTGGLNDIVDHKDTGYLAKPFDVKDFANGISWVLENNMNNQLSINTRNSALAKFSEKVIANKYLDLYKSVINDSKTEK